MEDDAINTLGARFVINAATKELVDLINFCTNELKLDATDFIILACIGHQSVMQGEMFKGEMDYKKEVCDVKNGVVNIKTIHYTLNMSRETVRRKLVHLENRGFIRKVKGGYIWIPQYGHNDKMYNIRKYLFDLMNRQINNIAIIQQVMNR